MPLGGAWLPVFYCHHELENELKQVQQKAQYIVIFLALSHLDRAFNIVPLRIIYKVWIGVFVVKLE